ncbi:MAG: DUF47 family protein [Vampirovibrionales bacterium]|nr:DUF47 family protein [Vampirovibrionales bacterium]
MLHMLLPKEEKFHKLLHDQGVQASQSIQALYDLVHHKGEPQVLAAQIQEIKNEAKSIHEKLILSISNTLITPFDREDIQELSVELYDIPKKVNKIKDRLINHNLSDFEGDLIQFVDVLRQCDKNMDDILKELSGKLSTKNIPFKATRLSELEDQCNDLLDQTMVKSFESVSDTRELILRVRLYEMLERVSDYYRDAGNVALRIVLKHS